MIFFSFFGEVTSKYVVFKIPMRSKPLCLQRFLLGHIQSYVQNINCTNYSVFFSIFRWQESIAGVSLDDICDIRERNCAARMLDINFVEEIAWLKYDFFLLLVIIIFDV